MLRRPLTGRTLARAAAQVLLTVGAAAALPAQIPGAVPLGQTRTVQGVVAHPDTAGAPVPVPHQLVVLHRVGQDTAGPIDSTRTDARGQYEFKYKTTGSPDAVYFASSTYAGIAYFTAPLQDPNVTSPGGDITVFDTTSRGPALTLAGRHLVISAPGPTGVREVAEVFDLQNAGARTLIARDTVTPLWSATLPPGAISPGVSGGDIAPGAVTFNGGGIQLFAPMSPGVRQLALAFGLPASAFPLTVPMTGGAGVLELLLEEASATPSLPGLAQQASVTSQGRTFKRYLAQNVPDGAVLRIDAGGAGGSRSRLFSGIAFAMAILMAVALTIALRRRSRPAAAAAAAATPAPVPPVLINASKSESLRFQLAQLDAAFARETTPSPARAAAHAAQRDALEARIRAALAEEGDAP